MNPSSTVWLTEDIARNLGISGTEYPCRILELKELLYELLKEGGRSDIVVLPYFRKVNEMLAHLRARNISGPVMIYTQGEIMPLNLMDLASEGVVFMDATRFPKTMMAGFICFLQKAQNLGRVEIAAEPAPRAAGPPGGRPATDVRAFFKRVMGERQRLIITCQFKADLPTLTVTCELIQMVGEVETKLVLDKFNPQEFVDLYRQLAGDRPLNGHVTDGGESLGFDLKLASPPRGGKLVAFLPELVYAQKRKFFRVEPDPQEPVLLHILPDKDFTRSFEVNDISEGGVGLSIPYGNLDRGGAYPAALSLPRSRMILGEARIVFKGDPEGHTIDYGVNLQLHEMDMQQLRHYVFKRQAGILAAVRNMSL